MYNCTNIGNYLFIDTKKMFIHCLLRFIGYITNIYPLPVCIISVFNFKYNCFQIHYVFLFLIMINILEIILNYTRRIKLAFYRHECELHYVPAICVAYDDVSAWRGECTRDA